MMMESVQSTQLTLHNGVAIPQVGLGVFRAPRGEETQMAVLEALRVGYRHIDTARAYNNEADVGAAIRASGIAREEIFVTTKLWNDDQGYDRTIRAFEASLTRLGLGFIDLYLLHWPVLGQRLSSWQALETLYAEGRVKAIGVSNFMVHHLEELLACAKIVPMVDQIECSPFLQQRDVRDLCAKQGIIVEAYSPLTKGMRLAHPVVLQVATRYARTPAQILLRWGLQQGLVILPKSTRPLRIGENAELFDFALGTDAMKMLDALEEGLVTGWDPRHQP